MNKQTDTITSQVGERLFQSRRLAGFSRKNASASLNISESALYSYEKGKREITVTTLLQMIQLYNTTFKNLTNYKQISETIN